MTSQQTFSGESGTLAVSSSSVAETAGLQGWTRPDGRRTLQLVLATVWLIDGILQLQSFFFTQSFGLQKGDIILEVGSRRPDTDFVDYPDIDLRSTPNGFTHKDGSSY